MFNFGSQLFTSVNFLQGCHSLSCLFEDFSQCKMSLDDALSSNTSYSSEVESPQGVRDGES